MMPKRLTALAAAGLASLACVAGCGEQGEHEPPAPEHPAETVMISALETAYTTAPQKEEPGAAWDRARPALDPDAPFPGQGTAMSGDSGTGSPLGEWYRWRADGVELVEATATVLPDRHPADTDDTAQRVVKVDRTTHTGDDSSDEDPMIFYATAVVKDDQWLLSAAQQQQ